MSKWQPIGTAPRKRVRVLLYFPKLPEHCDQRSKIAAGCWVETGWWVSAVGCGGLYGGRNSEIHPSHWMPLPDPPKETNDTQT